MLKGHKRSTANLLTLSRHAQITQTFPCFVMECKDIEVMSRVDGGLCKDGPNPKRLPAGPTMILLVGISAPEKNPCRHPPGHYVLHPTHIFVSSPPASLLSIQSTSQTQDKTNVHNVHQLFVEWRNI